MFWIYFCTWIYGDFILSWQLFIDDVRASLRSFLLTGPLKNSPNKLLEKRTLSVAAGWRITQHSKSLLLLLSFFLPLSPLPSASLLFSASITPVVFIRGSKAAVMRQSIFLGWWGRTQAISLSRWLPASPLAVLQQVERDQSGEDLRDAAGGETDEVLWAVSSKHTHSITAPVRACPCTALIWKFDPAHFIPNQKRGYLYQKRGPS